MVTLEILNYAKPEPLFCCFVCLFVSGYFKVLKVSGMASTVEYHQTFINLNTSVKSIRSVLGYKIPSGIRGFIFYLRLHESVH